MSHNFSDKNFWMFNEFTIKSLTQECKVQLPINIVAEIIPSVNLETFKDTKVFEIRIENLETCISLINQLIVRYLNTEHVLKLSDLSLEELTALYSFCDLYMDPQLYYTLMVKKDIRDTILNKKLGYLYHSYMYLYFDRYRGEYDILVDHLNELLKQIGYEDLYYFYYDNVPPLHKAIHIIKITSNKDIEIHKQTLKYLLKKADAFNNKVDEEVLLILESMDIEQSFLESLRGIHKHLQPMTAKNISEASIRIPQFPTGLPLLRPLLE